MTNNKDFPAELNPRKSSSSPVKKSSNQEQKYIETLESEKASLLEQVANYVKEQQASVKVFADKETLLAEKDKQLVAQEEQIGESEELISKLKARISQLAKDKKVYATTIHRDSENEVEKLKTNATTQTEETNSPNWEEQLLEKRLQSLQEFSSYREQLQQKENEITQLKNQLKKLNYSPIYGKEKLFLLAILLIILITCLLLK